MNWAQVFTWGCIVAAFGGFGAAGDWARRLLAHREQTRRDRLAEKRPQDELEQARNRPPEPVCGCTHHLAKHARTGECHEAVQAPTAWDAHHKPVEFAAQQCNCQQYVGPQPLATLYAPDLTDLDKRL